METQRRATRASLPGEAVSLWVATTPQTEYPALAESLSVDVAVLGGGIAGLTAALLLKRSGARVAVPTRTLRKHVTDSGETFLVIGGENHGVGHVTDTVERYRNAEAFAREHFQIQSIPYRWSTQDNRPMDRIPFIGHHSLSSRRLYVATGFHGWGLTNGTVAGRILADMLTDRHNPWQEVFDAIRFTTVLSKGFISHNVHVAGTFIKDHVPGGKHKPISELAPGEAAIADKDYREVAAFRDEQGQLHTVSPVCVHMGCKVRWNNAEQSWDCPCHGSRYRYDGTIIHAPATRDLETKT